MLGNLIFLAYNLIRVRLIHLSLLFLVCDDTQPRNSPAHNTYWYITQTLNHSKK